MAKKFNTTIIVSGGVGIGSDDSPPRNLLDVGGSVAIGSSYAFSKTAPKNGLIVQGRVGIGNLEPTFLLDIGSSGSLAGTLRLAGGKSGGVTVQTREIAGDWTLTLPDNCGEQDQFLRTDGKGVTTWSNIRGTVADPSASVGLTAVNGISSSYMRSDAAPRLDTSISPVWTGSHIFRQNKDSSSAFQIQRADSSPGLILDTQNVRMGVGNPKPEVLLDLGTSGKMRGEIQLAGQIAGKVILHPADESDVWTLTLPANSGKEGFALITDGTGITSWGPLLPTLGNPTSKIGLRAFAGTAATAMRSDATPALDVSIYPQWTGQHTFLANSLGIAQDDRIGIVVRTTSQAKEGLPQISPALRFRGFGWKTQDTAGSQSIDFRQYVIPQDGVAYPTGKFVIESSINGAAYIPGLAQGTDGSIITSGARVINREAIAGRITLSETSHYVGVIDTTSQQVLIKLPSAAKSPSGRILIIKDESGNCSNSDKIIIEPANDDTIDDIGYYAISQPHGCVKIISDGISRWFTI